MTRLALALGWILLLTTPSWRSGAAQGRSEEELPSPFTSSWTVRGYGLTEEGARRDALNQAAVLLRRASESLSLSSWKPDAAFVGDHLQDGPGRPGPSLTLPDLGPTCTWDLRLRPMDPAQARILDGQAARAEREGQRREWMIRILLAGMAGVTLLAIGSRWLRSRTRIHRVSR